MSMKDDKCYADQEPSLYLKTLELNRQVGQNVSINSFNDHQSDKLIVKVYWMILHVNLL